MKDILRDSTVGQILNWASKGRILPYEDQRADYVVPARYLPDRSSTAVAKGQLGLPRTHSDANTLVNEPGTIAASKELGPSDIEKAQSTTPSQSAPAPDAPSYPYLVNWAENDQDNPRNWSKWKRVFVGFLISMLTFSVYIGSAIYTSAIPSLMAEFHVSLTVATLGLTLFVLAYGIGPMFLGPLQDMPSIGRNPIYIGGLALFVIFQAPIVAAPNFATILVFRFLSGFVGSPALATGGASMADIFPFSALPVAIGVWSLGAVCGPVLGPVVGGFAAEANGWRWPNYELLWISGFSLLLLGLCLPETLGSTILVRRAERLRKLTGNPLLKTQYELDRREDETAFQLAKYNFIRAIQLCAEPAVLFANSYIALVYAIFYLWFESFPLVFNEIYHFSLGIAGLPYLSFVVSGAITFTFYVLYQEYHMKPRLAANPNLPPEARLELGLLAGCIIPISLLMFGWSARTSVHWIVPVIGAGLYLPGIFLLFQCIMVYLSMGWPKYAAAILAGNDLFRSSFASVFPLFGHAYFKGLGLGGGSSLLAGLSILMVPLLFLLVRYGGRLRANSKWTD